MKSSLTQLRHLFLLLPLALVWGCGSDEDPDPQNVVLVSSETRDTKSAALLAPIIQLTGVDLSSDDLQYDVELMRITYNTTVNGQIVEASALVILPDTQEEVGVMSFHRGTITLIEEAPSELPLTDIQLNLFSGLASIGLVAVFPDMIGFGSTAEMVHPYYIREINANTVRDAITATSELMRERSMSSTGELYLAGYSQGGYITMVAQESIQQTPIDGLELVASFPAAGAYDVKGLQRFFFNLDTYEQPYYMAYVGLGYQEYYSLDLELSDFFNDPYADRIPALFDGTFSNQEINEQLSFDIVELLNPAFLEGLETDSEYAEFDQLLGENAVLDWVPNVPTFLYHGDADTFIPVENSIDTFAQLRENGASDNILSLTIIQGADHGGGVVPYASDVVDKLLDFIQ